MKKIFIAVFTVSVFSTGFSQNVVTENWDNGQKKQEGILYGSVEMPKTDLPAQRAERMKNSLKDGKWSYWYKNGVQRAEENYKMGVETGIWKSWYENGQQGSEVNYETGKAVYWYTNGAKNSEGTMLKGGKHDGKWTAWFENGQLNYIGNYKNGQKDGEWIWYDQKGKITAKETFDAGIKTASKN